MTPPSEPTVSGHAELDRLLAYGGRDPASRAAARALEWAIRNRQPIVTDGTLLAWLRLWRHGLTPTMVTAGIAEQHQLNQLGRAALRLDGQLVGPDLQLRTGLRVAVGDQLVVTAGQPRRPDPLEAGVLLHVVDVYPAGQICTVDIPTFGGRRDVSTAHPLVRRVSHAYATTHAAEQQRSVPGAALEPGRGLSW
jgi:hypothetical protein